jgi:hypothetical protein
METHLTPSGLAGLARKAGADVLVPVHCYPPLDPQTLPAILAGAGFEGRVLPGWDGLALHLRGGRVEVADRQVPSSFLETGRKSDSRGI